MEVIVWSGPGEVVLVTQPTELSFFSFLNFCFKLQ